MRKLIFSGMFILLVSLIIGCQNKKNNNEVQQANETVLTAKVDTTVIMTGMPDFLNSASDTIKVSIINNTNQETTTGEYYTIEKYDGEAWQQVPLELAFIDIAYILRAGESREFNIFLHPEMHKYEAGKYRVAKNASTESNNYKLYYEFELKI